MPIQLPLLDPRDVAPAAFSARSARGRGPASPDPRSAARRPLRAAASPTARAPRHPASLSTPGDFPYWRLDDHTRELGLRGVEEARRALAAAVQRTGRASAA
jgi:hypothetical protein